MFSDIEVTKYSAFASLYIYMYEPQIYLLEDSGFPLAWIEVAGVYTAAFDHSTLALDFFGGAHGSWTVAPGL